MMDHLPGFWEPECWDDEAWQEYQKRRSGWGKVENFFSQAAHWWMGWRARTHPFLIPGGRAEWEEREAKQWPSKTGAYDSCEDHYWWLLGAGLHREAEELRDLAHDIRPEFLA